MIEADGEGVIIVQHCRHVPELAVYDHRYDLLGDAAVGAQWLTQRGEVVTVKNGGRENFAVRAVTRVLGGRRPLIGS